MSLWAQVCGGEGQWLAGLGGASGWPQCPVGELLSSALALSTGAPVLVAEDGCSLPLLHPHSPTMVTFHKPHWQLSSPALPAGLGHPLRGHMNGPQRIEPGRMSSPSPCTAANGP